MDTVGNVVTPAVDVDEDKLEQWEIKAEKAGGALKTAMSSDLRVDEHIRTIKSLSPVRKYHMTSIIPYFYSFIYLSYVMWLRVAPVLITI